MIHKDRAWARRQKGDSLSHQPLPHIHFSLAACPAQSLSVDLWGHPVHLGHHLLGCQPSLVYTFPDGPGSATLPPPRPPSAWACRRQKQSRQSHGGDIPSGESSKGPVPPARAPSVAFLRKG